MASSWFYEIYERWLAASDNLSDRLTLPEISRLWFAMQISDISQDAIPGDAAGVARIDASHPQTFRSWLDTAEATDVQYAEDVFDELDADASFLILGNAAAQQRARDEEGGG